MKKRIVVPLLLSLLLLLGPAAAAGADGGKAQSGGGQDVPFDPFMRGTLLSGPTKELPWENQPDFLDSRGKNACPLLMAAYKTVLRDPLPGEEYNVHLAARYICGTVVSPGGVFSQNRTAGPYTPDRGYREGPTYEGTQVFTTIGGGVCKIASTLYNAVILSNLKVVERHPHSMPVPYVPYGQDATVYYGAKDFKFRNDTQDPVLIWAQGIDNILYIGFYGRTVPPEVTWSHEVLRVYRAPVYFKKNPELPPDTQRILHEGMDGAVIRSQITLHYPDGTSETRDLGKSYYDPLPWVKEISG